MIFHFAAQSIVSKSLLEPYSTFNTNVMGSVNVLQSSINCGSSPSLIMITSDKCYKQKGKKIAFNEEDELGGDDPYSASKAAAEILIRSVYLSLSESEKSKVKLAICRAGNSIGGGDWGDSRIVPDCMRAWSENKKVGIRSPNSIRPWQHVLDSIGGYLWLMEKLDHNNDLSGEAFNFGPSLEQDITVGTLVNELANYWGMEAQFSFVNSNINESNFLKVDSSKAYRKLSWKPVFSFKESLEMTSIWYKIFYLEKSESIIYETDRQIRIAQEKLSTLSKKNVLI